MQNLGLAVISMVSGMIVDGYGYIELEVFFIGWLIGEQRNIYKLKPYMRCT